MTNEEKAKEIIKMSETKQVYDVVDIKSLEEALYDDLMQMAEWKDEQFENEKQSIIEEAIGWIDYNNRNGGCNFDGWEKDFKQAMKGGE